MAPTLEILLQRIADGQATDSEVAEARALLDAFEAEAGPLGDAILDAADDFDVADAVMSALDAELSPVAEAVWSEAGEFDGAAAVMQALELAEELAVGEAVHAEAGTVDVSAAVMSELGLEQSVLGEAVRAAAGPVDVTDAVMRAIATPAAMPNPVTAVSEHEVLQPANNGTRWMVGLLAAAMAAVVIGGGALLGTGGGIGAQLVPEDMMFASASEVEIEDLSFGEDVVVFQDEGDDGALILWIDEEVL